MILRSCVLMLWLVFFVDTAAAVTNDEKSQLSAQAMELLDGTAAFNFDQKVEQLRAKLDDRLTTSERAQISRHLVVTYILNGQYKQAFEIATGLKSLADRHGLHREFFIAQLLALVSDSQFDKKRAIEGLKDFRRKRESLSFIEEVYFEIAFGFAYRGDNVYFYPRIGELLSTKNKLKELNTFHFELYMVHWILSYQDKEYSGRLENTIAAVELAKEYDYPLQKFILYYNMCLYLNRVKAEKELALLWANAYVNKSVEENNRAELFFAYVAKTQILTDLYRNQEALETVQLAEALEDYSVEHWKNIMLIDKARLLTRTGQIERSRDLIEQLQPYFESQRMVVALNGLLFVRGLNDMQTDDFSKGLKLLNEYEDNHNNFIDKIRLESEKSLFEQIKKNENALALANSRLLSFQVIGLLFSVLFCFFAFLLYRYWHLTRDLRTSRDQLEKISQIDDLSELHNRRFWNEQFEQEFFRLMRSTSPCTLLVFDIDYFKSINDNFGHTAGDLVIKHTADIIRDSIRHSDLVGRLGGDEFAILLRETPIAEAHVFAERFQEKINKFKFNYQSRQVEFTISCGLAQFEAKFDSALQWFNCADKALYLSKRKGRNCISEIREHRESRQAG